MWTSLFHTERPLVAAPQTTNTKTSKVDVHYPPVETRALKVESTKTAMPPSASSILVSKDAISTESIIVKKGQSIKMLSGTILRKVEYNHR